MTTDAIMARVDKYAAGDGMHESDNWKTLRAAVEQIVAERDALKQGPYVGIEYYQAEVERAERAERERDEAIALLKEARGVMVWGLVDLRSRIDAVLKAAK